MARYLEIINHIVTRDAREDSRREREKDEERRETQATGSMDLSGTLINSQLLIMASALPPHPPFYVSLAAHASETHDDDGTIVRGVTMRCQQDRGHIFPEHDH